MKSFSDTFTQGGQTQLHKLRMMSQVVGSTLKVALFVAFVSLLGLILCDHSWSDFWFLACYSKAYVRLSLDFLPSDLWQTSWITWDGAIYREVSDLKIITHPSSTLFVQYLLLSLLKKILQATVIFFLSSVGVAFFWVLMGYTASN